MKRSLNTGSIWELTAPAAPLTEQLATDLDVDVLIIGAGFSGLSTALKLAGSSLSLALIEAHSIAWGASGRNGGHVLPLIRQDPSNIMTRFGDERGQALVRMVASSADDVFSIIRNNKIECDAEQNGWIQAAHTHQQLENSKDRYQQWQAFDADMEILDRQGIAQFMGTDAYVGGLLVRSGGHINPLAYARGLANVVLKKGCKLFTDTPALGVESVKGRWRVSTPKGIVTASKVVLATAAYSDDLWPKLKKSFIPFYLYNVATKPLSQNLRESILPGRQPVTDTRGDSHVFHYDGDGRLITGGTFIFPYFWEGRLISHARKVLSETFPQLVSADFESDYLWRGKVSMTVDVLPHVHVLAPNFYTWLGCNARGIALSTSMGAVLADAVMDVPPADWALAPTEMQAIPTQSMARLMSLLMLGYYRGRDKFIS